MKMKKLVPILALVLGLSAFSGCTDTDQKIMFGEYWQLDALAPETIHETLVYDVSFNANTKNSTDYTLNYKGTYTTTLSTVIENGVTSYVYATMLTVTPTYDLKGVKSNLEPDVITSKVQFHGSKGALEPIRSEKYIKSASPTTGSHVSVTQCYQEYTCSVVNDYTTNTSVVTNYDKDGKELDSKTTNFTFEDADKYNVIDNEQLFIALRATPDTVTSGTLLCYSPFANLAQNVKFTFAAADGAEFKYMDLDTAKEVKKTINYRPVSITLDQKNPGATQTAWIASKLSSGMNTTRNVMLRLETPIAYDLGTLIYTLSGVSYK